MHFCPFSKLVFLNHCIKFAFINKFIVNTILFTFPDLVGSSPELAENLKVLHEALNVTLAALIVLHVVAALLHPDWLIEIEAHAVVGAKTP